MSCLSITKWGGIQIAWVDSNSPRDAINCYFRGEVDGLGFSPYKGFKAKNISFLLDEVPNLKSLILSSPGDLNLEVVSGLTDLELLSIGETSHGVDLHNLKKLKDLSLIWNSRHRFPSGDVSLSRLYLKGYSPKSKNLEDLTKYETLKVFELVQGNIVSLSGIENFHSLQECEFSYMPRLTDIKYLCATTVNSLTFDTCKSIANIGELRECEHLRVLRYLNCGSLDSLEFIKAFYGLEEFTFVKTKILDGNMEPLLSLKRVGFLKQRGYSHTPEEIKKAIGQIV